MARDAATTGRLVGSAVRELRSRIASGEWPVGSRIPTEPELCELLGVGRSTVREATRALATLGMLEPLTARGTFVRAVSPAPALLEDAFSAYAPAELAGLRRGLDVEAAQAAAAHWGAGDLERMEAVLHREAERLRGGEMAETEGSHCSRFHGAIVRASGNRLLADLDASLSAAVRARGLEARLDAALDVAVCLDEHDRILTAIRDRDAAGAAHRMAVHADAVLRGLGHEPVVTELVRLVARDRRPDPRMRGRHPA